MDKNKLIEFLKGRITALEGKKENAMFIIKNNELAEFYRGKITAFEDIIILLNENKI